MPASSFQDKHIITCYPLFQCDPCRSSRALLQQTSVTVPVQPGPGGSGGAGGHGGGGGGGGGSCFPAAARVLLPDGTTRRMDQLATGDAVAVRLANGQVGYQPIYAW